MPGMLWIVSNALVVLTAWFGQAKQDADANSEVAEKNQPRADIYGEPLPSGALARMGTIQFRHPSGSTKNLYYSPTTSVAFAPDGQVITTGLPQSLRFWNANTGNFLFEIESPDFWGGQVYSPDGRFIAAPLGHLTPEKGVETYAGVWDVKTRKLHHRFPPENGFGTHIWHIAFSRDGKQLAMAHEKGAIHLWNLDTGQEVAVFHQASKGGPLAGIAFSQDGKTLVSMPYRPDEFWHWDLAKRRAVKVVSRAIKRTQNQSLWLSYDGALACLYGTDGIVHTLDTSTGEELWAQPAGGRIAFTPDGRFFANAKLAVERAIDVTLRDAKTGNALRSFTMPPILQEEGYLAFSPDGSRMANGGFYPRLFDVANGNELLRKPAHESFVYGLAFTPDSKTLLSGGADHMIGVWDVATGKNRHFVTGNRWIVTGVAAVPGGDTFVSGGQDGIIRLHDWRTGKEVRRFGFDVGKNERSPQFKKLQVSPDGKQLPVKYSPRTEAKKLFFTPGISPSAN